MSWALFIVKKVVAAICYPLGTALILWLIGVVLWIRRPGSRVGILLVALGGLWLLIMSLPATGVLLLRPLERAAGAYADPAELNRQGVRHIVVLGGDVRTGDLSSPDRLANSSLVRVLEAIRLWKSIPDGKMVLSGGRYLPTKMTTGEAMAVFAKEMGVPAEAILLEAESWDTDDEARLLVPVIKDRPFALVTSACHMIRSIRTFRRHGLHPLAAPADFEVKFVGLAEYVPYIPGTTHLSRSEKAIHEYLGITLLGIKQWMPVTIR